MKNEFEKKQKMRGCRFYRYCKEKKTGDFDDYECQNCLQDMKSRCDTCRKLVKELRESRLINWGNLE